MPFVPNTPESFLGRSDSKNPNATCRGITSDGRPCRRPLTTTTPNNPPRSRLKTPNVHDENVYCWQHKEQASYSAGSSPGPRPTRKPILEERTSLDTLADRLGLIDMQEKPKRKPGPAMTYDGRQPSKMTRPKPSKFCFCFSLPADEVQEYAPARPQARPVQPTSASVPNGGRRPKQQLDTASSQQRLNTSAAPPGKGSSRSHKSNSSQTAHLKKFIPDNLDVTIASALMAELARPFVDSEEAGYIYMFWLTPTSGSAPPVDAARSLLSPPPSAGAARSRRASDVVSQFADKSGGTKHKTMLLKIGRAANVQRRMNQWQRQCGHDIEMLRYYPYLPGASESSGVAPHMTPHCHRVERLIHIELSGLGFRANMGTCKTCGKEHREWFEAEATRDGIRKVDSIIRRWIEWDERNA